MNLNTVTAEINARRMSTDILLDLFDKREVARRREIQQAGLEEFVDCFFKDQWPIILALLQRWFRTQDQRAIILRNLPSTKAVVQKVIAYYSQEENERPVDVRELVDSCILLCVLYAADAGKFFSIDHIEDPSGTLANTFRTIGWREEFLKDANDWIDDRIKQYFRSK